MESANSLGRAGSIPQAMVSARRWLLWKLEANADPSKKPKKIPCYVDGTRRDKTDTPEDASRLATFDQVVSVYNAASGQYAGIGFALGPDGTGNYWQGFDADNVPAEHVDRWIAEHAHLGYAEVSPSGRGVHIIGYGQHFATFGPNGTDVEAYAGGRYFTVTGDRGRGVPACIAAFVNGPVAARHGAGRPTADAGAGSVYVDPKTVSELRSALTYLRSDERELWVAIGQALKELGEVGRSLWIEWSQTSEKWEPADARKWDSFDGDRTGYRAVFAKAQAAGWVNPASNAAQLHTQQASEAWTPLTGEQLIALLSFDCDNTELLPEDIVAELVADEEVTLLGGHGGVGKGFLSLQIAVAVALGGLVLGRRARQCRVLYYSAEDGRKRLGKRLRKLLESYDEEQRKIIKQNLLMIDASEVDSLYGERRQNVGTAEKPYFTKILGPKADYENLQKMVATFDPQLLIVDGASDTFDGNEIVKHEVRAFLKLLRFVHPTPGRKIGTLLLVHIDRAAARGHASSDEGYSGNVAWHNSARRRMYLKREVQLDSESKAEIGETITLQVKKNQDGPPMDDLELFRSPDGFWLSRTVQFTGELAKAMGQPEPEDHAKVILRLIDQYFRRGQHIGTSLAANSTTGVWASLRGDKQFPRKLDADKTFAIVRNLERDGHLTKDTYKSERSRRWEECWKVVPDPIFTAPTAEKADAQSEPK